MNIQMSDSQERSNVTGERGAAWGMEYMKILELQCNYLIIS